MTVVIKRDGREVEFSKQKIIDAILGAMKRTEKGIDEELALKIASSIEGMGKSKLEIEQVQDLVENKLMNSSRKDVAKEYILYREQRTLERENNSVFMKMYDSIINVNSHDILQENANVDGHSPMGVMGKIGYESAKIFATRKVKSKEIKKLIEDGYIYPHDWDFSVTGTTTCCQIPLGKLLETGFDTGHGFIRTPSNIISATALSAIILQANQNQQHGGQSFPMFDYDLAPYVTKTYNKHLKELKELPLNMTPEQIEEYAWNKTRKDTFQAMEAFVHNMNSMNSRSSGQVPFSSINYGTDTSKEGRLVTESVLRATESGLGNGETPIFPIQIFKVKEGISYNENDINYDLFKLACEVSSKRLFPNFSFIDATFNLEKYDKSNPHTEVAYMG